MCISPVDLQWIKWFIHFRIKKMLFLLSTFYQPGDGARAAHFFPSTRMWLKGNIAVSMLTEHLLLYFTVCQLSAQVCMATICNIKALLDCICSHTSNAPLNYIINMIAFRFRNQCYMFKKTFYILQLCCQLLMHVFCQLWWKKREEISERLGVYGRGVGGFRRSHPHSFTEQSVLAWTAEKRAGLLPPAACSCESLTWSHMWQPTTNSRIHCAGNERAQELPLQGWQPDAISGTMRTGTHTSCTLTQLCFASL